MAEEMRLFPLGNVLFPGMILPLHIFEQRYRIMIQECIDANAPFGVVAIDQGHEVGGVADPFNIGTAARITHVQKFEDGRFNIQTVGYQRIRVTEFLDDRPYPAGMVEEYPIEAGASVEGMEQLVKDFAPEFHTYLNMLMEATDSELEIDELPDDGLALALFAAITMPVPTPDKQAILEQTDVVGMINTERTMLKREMMLLRHMIAKDQNGGAFSAN